MKQLMLAVAAWILFCNAWRLLCFHIVFCNYYHIDFGYFGLYSRIRLRDAALEK